MSCYDVMREEMNHAIEHDICNLYFYHLMMGLINKAESEHKSLYDEFMNAKGENKDLRKQIGDADRINGRLIGENESLKAKNEQLRELVRDMWHDGMCDCDEQYTCNKCCEYHYHERMRELGIEVE